MLTHCGGCVLLSYFVCRVCLELGEYEGANSMALELALCLYGFHAWQVAFQLLVAVGRCGIATFPAHLRGAHAHHCKL